MDICTEGGFSNENRLLILSDSAQLVKKRRRDSINNFVAYLNMPYEDDLNYMQIPNRPLNEETKDSIVCYEAPFHYLCEDNKLLTLEGKSKILNQVDVIGVLKPRKTYLTSKYYRYHPSNA